MAFAVIYITHSNEAEAQRVSDILLENRLVACANVFPITSAYWWQNAIQHDSEWVSIVKTTLSNWKKVEEMVLAIHPYETPCIMKWEAEANAAYEAWIENEVGL